MNEKDTEGNGQGIAWIWTHPFGIPCVLCYRWCLVAAVSSVRCSWWRQCSWSVSVRCPSFVPQEVLCQPSCSLCMRWWRWRLSRQESSLAPHGRPCCCSSYCPSATVLWGRCPGCCCPRSSPSGKRHTTQHPWTSPVRSTQLHFRCPLAEGQSRSGCRRQRWSSDPAGNLTSFVQPVPWSLHWPSYPGFIN